MKSEVDMYLERARYVIKVLERSAKDSKKTENNSDNLVVNSIFSSERFFLIDKLSKFDKNYKDLQQILASLSEV